MLGDALGTTPDRVLLDRILALPDLERGPVAWSPDGKWVALAEAGGIRLIEVDGPGAHRIALADLHAAVANHAPGAFAWRPDGHALVLGTCGPPVSAVSRANLTREQRMALGDGVWVVPVPSAMQPTPTKATREAVDRLLPGLDARTFATREQASAALRALGPAAVPLLEDARQGASLEARRALDALIGPEREGRFVPRLTAACWTR